MLKEMTLSGLVVDSATNTPIIILKDLEDKDTLPIWVGLLEASAIVVEMEKIHMPRPMTHDLVKNILDSLSVKVSRVEVIDLRSLVPLDEETILQSVKKTNKVLVVHEDKVHGGFGGEVAAIITEKAFEYLDAPVKRVGSTFTPVGFNRILRHHTRHQQHQ